MRLFLVLLTIAAMVAGCSGGSDANAPEQGGKEDVEKAAEGGIAIPADVPEYALTKDEVTADPALGLRMRGVSASTKTTSAEGMEAITRELWSESEDAEALGSPPSTQTSRWPSYPARSTPSATGKPRAMLSSQYTDPSEANIDEQVEEAMANDGISVLSIQDEVDAAAEEMWAEWEVTNMGTPPPWDCPGY